MGYNWKPDLAKSYILLKIKLALIENQERTDFSKLAPLQHNFPFGKSASEVLRCCERVKAHNISYTTIRIYISVHKSKLG